MPTVLELHRGVELEISPPALPAPRNESRLRQWIPCITLIVVFAIALAVAQIPERSLWSWVIGAAGFGVAYFVSLIVGMLLGFDDDGPGIH